MTRRLSLVAIAAAVVLAAWGLAPDAVQAATYRTSNDLLYNYYVPAGAYGGVPTQLYLSPRPTPAVVGHTYVTYQPLMPHEMLYSHKRKYWSYEPTNGSWTRTLVVWQRSPFDLSIFGPPAKPPTSAAGNILEAMFGIGPR
jgi:hypothetical protein